MESAEKATRSLPCGLYRGKTRVAKTFMAWWQRKREKSVGAVRLHKLHARLTAADGEKYGSVS